MEHKSFQVHQKFDNWLNLFQESVLYKEATYQMSNPASHTLTDLTNDCEIEHSYTHMYTHINTNRPREKEKEKNGEKCGFSHLNHEMVKL